MTSVELLAMRLLDTATLEQRMLYQKLGANMVAELLIRTGEIFKKASNENGMQDLLQQRSGNNAPEGAAEPEKS